MGRAILRAHPAGNKGHGGAGVASRLIPTVLTSPVRMRSPFWVRSSSFVLSASFTVLPEPGTPNERRTTNLGYLGTHSTARINLEGTLVDRLPFFGVLQAVHQLQETLVVAQGIQVRVALGVLVLRVPRVDRLFKPIERVGFLSQERVRAGDVEGAHVSVPGPGELRHDGKVLLDRLPVLLGPVQTPRFLEDRLDLVGLDASFDLGPEWPPWRSQGERLLEISEGLVPQPLVVSRKSPVHVGERRLRIQVDGLQIVLDRLVEKSAGTRGNPE